MKNTDTRIIINKINEVIDSRSSKLSPADIEKLIVVREKIANAKDKTGLLEAIRDFLNFFKDI